MKGDYPKRNTKIHEENSGRYIGQNGIR